MIQLVYITCPNPEEARRIGSSLLEERLVACVNIFPQVHSMFSWEGSIQEESESVVIAKTSESRVDELINWVTNIHPYEVPCIEVCEISAANERFARWVEEETA